MDRFRKFSYILGQNGNDFKNANIDVRNYARYILLEGSKEDKRELLECLRGKIIIENKDTFYNNFI